MDDLKRIVRILFLAWLYVVGAVLSLIPILPSIVLTAVSGSPYLGQRIFGPIWGRTSLFLAGCRVNVKGRERFGHGAQVIVINHHTPYLFFAVCGYFPSPWCAVVRKELLLLPTVGAILRLGGQVVLDLDRPEESRAELRRATRYLRAGVSVIVAPEGRPSRTGRLLPFKRGAFDLAVEAKAPILPVLIRADWSGLLPRVEIRLLPPILTAHMSATQAPMLADLAWRDMARALEPPA